MGVGVGAGVGVGVGVGAGVGVGSGVGVGVGERVGVGTRVGVGCNVSVGVGANEGVVSETVVVASELQPDVRAVNTTHRTIAKRPTLIGVVVRDSVSMALAKLSDYEKPRSQKPGGHI